MAGGIHPVYLCNKVSTIAPSIARYSAFFLAFSAFTACAQTQSVSQWAVVDFNVRSSMQIAVDRNMSFGFVVQGQTTAHVDPITGGNSAAYFSLVAPPDTPLTVSFSSSPLSDGQNSISFSGTLAGNTDASQTKALLISSGTTIVTGPTGEYNFWAGGTAALSPTQPLGVYAGSLTLSVAY